MLAEPRRITDVSELRTWLPHLYPELRTTAGAVLDALSQAEAQAARQSPGGTPVRVAFLGQFKTGKSSVLNTLLGGDYMPVAVEELTGAQVEVIYGAQPQIFIHDGSHRRQLSPEAFSEEVRIDRAGAEGAEPRLFSFTAPVPFVRCCTLVDTPGTNGTTPHSRALAQAVIARALKTVDLCVLVLTKGLSHLDFQLARQVREAGRSLMLLLNRSDNTGIGEMAEARDEAVAGLARLLGERFPAYVVSAKWERAMSTERAAITAHREDVLDLNPEPLHEWDAFRCSLLASAERVRHDRQLAVLTAELGVHHRLVRLEKEYSCRQQADWDFLRHVAALEARVPPPMGLKVLEHVVGKRRQAQPVEWSLLEQFGIQPDLLAPKLCLSEGLRPRLLARVQREFLGAARAAAAQGRTDTLAYLRQTLTESLRPYLPDAGARELQQELDWFTWQAGTGIPSFRYQEAFAELDRRWSTAPALLQRDVDQVRAALQHAASNLNQEVDRLWQQWARTREPQLLHALRQRGMLPTGPPPLRALAALYSNQLEAASLPEGELVGPATSAISEDCAEVASRAERVLRGLRTQAAINQLCTIWTSSSNDQLLQIIRECGYRATAPLRARVWTALARGDQDSDEAELPEILAELLAGALHRDPNVAEPAALLLSQLHSPAAIEAVCARWLTARQPVLANVIARAGYISQSSERARVMTALCAGELDLLLEHAASLAPELFDAVSDQEPRIREGALACIAASEDPNLIDAICGYWVQHRTPILADLIRDCGFVAREPLPVRVMSALQAGRHSALEGEGAEGAEYLYGLAISDKTPLAAAAARALRCLKDRAAQSAICRKAIEGCHQASQAALEAGYLPADPDDCCIFLFLTHQWEAYEALDPSLVRLRRIYGGSPEGLRRRLVEALVEAPHTRFIRLLWAGSNSTAPPALQESEWERVIRKLETAHDHQSLWRVVQTAPLRWSRRALTSLKAAGFRPAADSERRLFDELIRHDALAPVHASEAPMGTVRAPARALAFSANGQLLATESGRHVAQIWKMPDRLKLREAPASGGPNGGFALSANGRDLAVGGGTVRIYDTSEWYPRLLPAIRTGVTTTLAFSPDGRKLAAGNQEGKVTIWDVESTQGLARLVCSPAPTRLLVFAAKTHLATGGEDGEIRIWRVQDGGLRATCRLHEGALLTGAFTPDGTGFVSVGADGQVVLWNVATGRPRWSRRTTVEQPTIAAISQDARLIAVSSGNHCIHLEPVEEHAVPGMMFGSSTPAAFAFHPNGWSLVCGDQHGALHVWDLLEQQHHRFTRSDLQMLEQAVGLRQRPVDQALLRYLAALVQYRIEAEKPRSAISSRPPSARTH